MGTQGPCVCDYTVYTMRLVQTALCAGPAINLPHHRTEYCRRLLFPNRSVLCCLSLASRSHQVVDSSRTKPPQRMQKVKVDVEFRVNPPR